jgi:putative ABC transport system permease protein
MPLRFAWIMAWRETRAGWRHFLYFFVCIALGVGALVGVGLFAEKVERTILREARSLMAGDLDVRLTHSLSREGETVLKSLASRGIATMHVSELVAMAAVLGPGQTRPTQIVELKAVEEGYPFYGKLTLDSDQPLTQLLTPPVEICRNVHPPSARAAPPPAPPKRIRKGRRSSVPPAAGGTVTEPPCLGAVVQEALLIRMGLAIGDRVKIGNAVFLLAGVLRKEPDRVAGAFSLGPRVMISREGLAAADLIKPGSRVRERYLLRVPPAAPIEPLVHELRGRLARESARVISYREGQPQLKRFLDQLARYLGLIGLTALFVGGIGVASTVQAFLREKLNTIAILKTLGADSLTVIHTYLIQALSLGLIGSVAGVLLGIGVQGTLPSLLSNLLPLDAIDLATGVSGLSLLPILKGVALGVLTTLLFTVWPLLGIRDIRPALIFRRDVATGIGRHPGKASFMSLQSIPLRLADWRRLAAGADRPRLLTALGIACGLAGLAVWQAGAWKIGLLFIGALVVAVAVLHVAAFGLLRVLRWLPGPRSLAIRHALGNVHRPGSQATGIMVSVGIGVMVIVAISLLERSLVDELGDNRPIDAPTFFFIDIQPDQREAVLRLIRERVPDSRPEVTPLVRSRLHAINGLPVSSAETGERPPDGRDSREERDKESRKHWYLTREYVLTFLDQIPKDNQIVKGRWWDPGRDLRRPLVSVEEDAARNMGLDVGTVIEVEIQGAIISAEVSSIRRVEWGNFSTNFYMILSPGSLEGAPFTYVATVRVPPKSELLLQQAVVAAFPNVTAINIGDVLDSFARILERLSLAIRAIALFCILTGGIVMAAALAATRYRRLYESVVLKALGATRGLIACSFATEYALLGTVAGLIGVILASLLAWAALYFILDMTWALHPAVLTLSVLLTVLLTLAVGFLSTFRLLGQRPLTVLRHE